MCSEPISSDYFFTYSEIKTMENIASCIKKTGNWSKIDKVHRFDHPDFSPARVANDITVSAPKLKKLVEKIRSLDDEDMKKHGKLFKHFIYSDVKSAYGAKLIASALASHGFEHAYHLGKSSKGNTFQMKKNLEKYGGNVFATLTSVLFFEKPIGVRFIRELLSAFNKRPDNIHGEQIRIIILDSGFREGVDLFDVKYVHLFEPILTKADQKQVIGRATRFCGQKGLHFEKNKGWPIYVYKYETVIPKYLRHALLSQNKNLEPANNFFDLFLKFTNIDPKKINFANELVPLVIFGAVDRYLTRNVHNFTIQDDTQNKHYQELFQGGTSPKLSKFVQMQKNIRENFAKFSWPPTKVENGCVASVPSAAQQKGPSIIEFSPTQNFVRNYFTAKSNYKGLLLMHSVGTGKTCSAIAVASSTFEKEDYTIIYVTRHTLKADVWKNMFGQTCSVIIQNMIKKGIRIPEAEAKRQRLIKAWMEPMSYKQFSNTILGKNSLYQELVKRNGKTDILKKTLVIIDEAHKLNAPDVAGSEKPDLDAIKKALLHSYKVSGKDSTRLLIMTATPYTDDPVDMMKLLNLLREEKEQLPETFDEFQKTYLDEEGKFTKEGRIKFLNEISGYVSYLNREKDVRSFSYPIIEDVTVPLSVYEFEREIHEYVVKYNEIKFDSKLLNLMKSGTQYETLELKNKLTAEANKNIETKQADLQACVEAFEEMQAVKIQSLQAEKSEALKSCNDLQKTCEKKKKEEHEALLQQMKEDNKTAIAKCKENVAPCKDKVQQKGAQAIAKLKEEAQLKLKNCKKGDAACKQAIKDKLADDTFKIKEATKNKVDECKSSDKQCKANLESTYKLKKESMKEDLKFDLKECSNEKLIKDCKDAVIKADQEKVSKLKDKDPCDVEKVALKAYEKLQKELIQNHVAELLKAKNKIIKFDEDKIDEKRKELRSLHTKIDSMVKNDRSQQLELEHCLKTQKVKPSYIQSLKGSQPEYLEEEEKIIEDIVSNVSSNVYLVNGHGYEEVKDFTKRVTLPEDKVLVVFPVCGRPNWMNITCLFMDIFNNPKYIKWMNNPIKHKKAIEDLLGYPIRIYLPGDKIPFISTNLFYNFDFKKTVVLKSGVFELGKIPQINRSRFPETKDMSLSLGNQACFKYIGSIDNSSHYNNSVHHEVFKGNKYNKAGTRDTYSNLVKRKYNVTEIMEDMGPGIYYYTGCRSLNAKVSDDMYSKILGESAKQQQKSHKATVIKNFKKNVKIEQKDKSDEPENSPVLSPQSSPNSVSNIDEENAEIIDKDLTNMEKKQLLIKRRRLLQIRKEAAAMLAHVITMTHEEKVDVIARCRELEKEIEEKDLDSVPALSDLVDIVKGNVDYKTTLQFAKVKKHYEVLVVREYKVEKKRYVVKEEQLGLLPVSGKSLSDKCTTETVVRRIKQLYKKGRLGELTLPKDVGDLENVEAFANLCKRSKELVLKNH